VLSDAAGDASSREYRSEYYFALLVTRAADVRTVSVVGISTRYDYVIY
jgi:hypothetical protein